jgi:myo-inositol-1(or 4)-monophosphatase
MSEISDYQTVCEQAVRSAGAVLLKYLGRVEPREKGPSDLVTEADVASQETVRRTVLGAFPNHSFLGEEDTGAAVAPRSEYRWIVDPLDGTTNYVHGLPFFAVSLALERNGEPLVGATYNPVTNECFKVAKGRGALCNGRAIRCSKVPNLSKAMAVAGFAAGANRNSPDVRVFLEAVDHCQSARRTGSASLNLAYLAAGRMDVFWSFSTKVWDVAAGVLMVREAGGVVTSPSGGSFVLDDAQFLAASSEAVHGEALLMVRKAIG